MNALLLTVMLCGGAWLVNQTNQAYDRMRTCRYRDYFKIRDQAERCEAGYRLIGLASLLLPSGPLVTIAVFGYALYRRFR
jgi:hypothetical protein